MGKKDGKKHKDKDSKKKKSKKEKKSKKDKDSKKHHKSEKKDGSSKKHKSHHSSSSSSSSSSDEEPTLLGPSLPPADYGPSLPPPGATLPSAPGIVTPQEEPSASIGPAIGPAGPPPRRDAEQEDSSGDEAGPSMAEAAPATSAASAQGPQAAGEGGKRIAGPSLPAGVDLEKLAHHTAKVDWERVAREEEEEELDLVGPAMPGQVTIGYARATAAAEARVISNMIQKQLDDEADKGPKHEAWMTMMPEEKALSLTLDEQASNRTFQRKEKTGRGDTSEWTDTPADKARKAREKAMGLGVGEKRKVMEEDAVAQTQLARQAALVEQYNKTVRPKSLFEINQEEAKKVQKSGTKKEVKEKDFLAGGWDRSEMESRGALNPKEAKKMLNDSMGLGSRFGPSSFQ